ncbi:MAG TPA: FecR domain-containing protein [Polyangia bacterium]
MSRLPFRPNARVDGLDARAASLAAFLAREAAREAASPAPSEGASERAAAARALREARVREARRQRIRRGAGAGAALGALAAAGLVAWTATRHLPAPSMLSYTVDGAAPPRDGYVRSSSAHEPELTFSDGTAIHMMPKARARVAEVSSRGARVVLEQGRAHVHVVHRPGADWQVQAGAFVVHVHGTAFFVEWNDSRFDLQMENGVVSVDGPRPNDTVILRAGQSLSVKPDGSRLVSMAPALQTGQSGQNGKESVRPAPGSMPVPVEAPIAAATPTTLPVPAPSPAPSSVAPAPALAAVRAPSNGASTHLPWSERLADGDAVGILAEAQRRGLSSVLRTASSEDLAALADAARFQLQDRLARRVLLTQRDRFPGTRRAQEASFLLGRLSDERGDRAPDALAWYERYLHEAPSGAYAAEAMGRMMIALERQQRVDEARAVATAYLRRFPQGVYARTAREVTSR